MPSDPIRVPASLIALCCIASACFFTSAAAAHEVGHPDEPAEASPKQPNILFMLADDQSWAGTSAQVHPDFEPSDGLPFRTPHLERLASESMRFSAAYAPAPVCAPSRASIMMGQNPARLGWTTVGQTRNVPASQQLVPPSSRRSIERDETTFAELLQLAGYRTAHFGKWHLGGGGPEGHGFDVSDGNIGNEAAGQHADPNPVDIFGMAERAEQFMQRAHDEGRPFFVQLSWLALHAPQNALEDTKAKYAQTPGMRARQRNRLALTEDLDTGVGRVLDAVDRLGLAGSTYVIYMSDNGGDRLETAPLSGGKGGVLEGGIRVPLTIRGPSIEAGSWCHVPVVGYDLFPTFVEWADAGTNLDERAVLDGASLAGVAGGEARDLNRSDPGLVFHFPHYQGDTTPATAYVTEQYKVILDHETGRVALYDLKNDIGERHDLSADEPERAAAMKHALGHALASMNAAMPSKNDDFDATHSEDSEPQAERGPRSRRQRNQESAGARPRDRGAADNGPRQRRNQQPAEEPDRAAAPAEEPSISVTIEGDFRVVRANGLPEHDTGTFPNRHNPHSISPQTHEYRLPLNPVMTETPTPSAGEFGICANGVIMDAGTGEFWTAERDRVFGARSIWNYEALGGGINLGLDHHNAHVQGSGKYHYHGLPSGLVESQAAKLGRDVMIHIGWAFDGFPIYAGPGHADPMDPSSDQRELRSSYRLKEGERPGRPDGPGGAYDGTFGHDWEYVEGLGDLDACNGRFGVTPEHPEGTYYYVITEEFPSIPRLWRGTPDPSSMRRGPENRQDRGRGRSGGRAPERQRP